MSRPLPSLGDCGVNRGLNHLVGTEIIMDERIGTSTSSRVQSLSPDVGRFSPGLDSVGASTKAVAKPFEWVQYGDPAARKRARAHVTRGYRRQQAEAAQQAKLQAGCKSKSPSASPITQSSPISTREDTPPEEHTEDTAVVLHSQSQAWDHDARQRQLPFNPFIQRAIQSGNTDPFNALPIRLNLADHAVLTHCMLLSSTSCPHTLHLLIYLMQTLKE